MSIVRQGGCHCGAVRFRAMGEPKFVGNCHCRDCRRATGAAFSTWVGYDTEQVAWEGPRAIHHSSETVSRGFCAGCGTPLSYSGRKWAAETHLLIGCIDDDTQLKPTGDGFRDERLDWVRLVSE